MDGEHISPAGRISGAVQGYQILPDRGKTNFFCCERGVVKLPGWWLPVTEEVHNDILYDWATIIGQLLRGSIDGKSYNISAMYLEFANSGGAPADPLPVQRDENLSYYNSLADSAVRDYLRVRLTATTITSSDAALFPDGNVINFFAQSEGVTGVHGKDCSATVGSRFYGGALVAARQFDDPDQDLILSRFYFGAANQIDKLAGNQIGLRWPITLQ